LQASLVLTGVWTATLASLPICIFTHAYTLIFSHVVLTFFVLIAGVAGAHWGVDGNAGVIADMRTLNILDPYAVKAQTYKTAIESAASR
jgi:hypothetical protein